MAEQDVGQDGARHDQAADTGIRPPILIPGAAQPQSRDASNNRALRAHAGF